MTTGMDVMCRGSRRQFFAWVCAALLVCSWLPGEGVADARARYLIRLLQGSAQFRVRAQAAISLGVVTGDPDVEAALLEALHDTHPAVRAAAATSLGSSGTGRAIGPLERAASDPEKPVRAAAGAALASLRRSGGSRRQPPTQSPRPGQAAKFYVAIGAPKSRDPGLSSAHLTAADSLLRRKVAGIDGVEVAPAQETPRQAKAILKQRRLVGYYIEGAVTDVQKKPGGGTRVAVSLILSTYPDRNMRAMLKGAATAVGGGDATIQQALDGAFTGALRKLPQALGR